MLHRLRLPFSISSVVVLSVVIVVVLGGCGSAANANDLHSASGAAPGNPTVSGLAPMRAQPNGPATLTWDPANHGTLTVDLAPTGLAPLSPSSYTSAPYPAEIGAGDCQAPGKAVYPLTAVKADQYGVGSSTTTVKDVAGGIPAKDWHLALYFPAAANEKTLLACTLIINPTPSTTEKQTVKAWLHGLPHEHGGDDGAYGMTRLSLSGTTLTVDLYIGGMAPGSKHAAHIHSGSCEKQGPVVHNLKDVVADADGNAHIQTTIQNVQSIPGNWFVNVHHGTDLTTQAGFQPISCGNVFTRQ